MVEREDHNLLDQNRVRGIKVANIGSFELGFGVCASRFASGAMLMAAIAVESEIR